MSIQIVHISDLHLNDGVVAKKKIEHLASMFSSNHNQRILLVTGDITFSGKKKEFDLAEKFLEELSEKSKEKFRVLLVPGNHDVTDFKNLPVYKKGKEKEYSGKFLKKMDPFFQFAKKYDLYMESKLYHTEIIADGKKKIKFNLLNSTIHIAENFQYFDIDCLEKMEQHCDYNFFVTHHSIDSFYQQIKNQLEVYIDGSEDSLIFGHEHNSKITKEEWDHSTKMVIRAGEFIPNVSYLPDECFFNEIILDIDSKLISLTGYKWEGPTQGYICKEEQKNYNIIKHRGTNFNEKYFEHINEKNSHFIFPKIATKGRKVKKINNIGELYKIIRKKNIVIVEGDSRSGKSSLFRHIQQECPSNEVSILIDNTHKGKVGNVVQEQYNFSKNSTFYMSKPKEEKTLLIDDIDKLKDISKISSILTENLDEFGTIIISCNNIMDIETQLISNGFDVTTISIQPCIGKKREELIRKIKPSLSNEELHRIIKVMNSEGKMLRKTPEEVIIYTNVICDPNFKDSEKETSYLSIFSQNLQSIVKKIDSLEYKQFELILEELAYRLHIMDEKISISADKFIAIVKEYNETYEYELNPYNVIQDLVQSRIFYYYDISNISFSDNNTLSYFVARSIQRKMKNNINDVNNVIMNILDNITFGINSNIMLFLSYISLDANILSNIIKASGDFMNGWSEIDLNLTSSKNNTPLFQKNDNEIMQIRSRVDEKKEEIELEKHEHELRYVNDYNYEITKENEFIVRIQKARMYTEILAKILFNFQYVLTKDQKHNISKMLMENPYKISNAFLDDLVKYVDTIKHNLDDKKKNELEATANFLVDIIIVSTCNYHAKFIPDMSTYKVIEKYLDINEENLLLEFQKLNLLASIQEHELFMQNVEKFSRKLEHSNIHKMVCQVYMIENEKLNTSERQQINSLYLDPNHKKKQKELTTAYVKGK